MSDTFNWDSSLFDPEPFTPVVTELRYAYPLVRNWLTIIRATASDALDWAKAQNGYSGATPVYVRHLESARVNDDTEVPVVAVRPMSVLTDLNDDKTLVQVNVEMDTFIMIGGENPDTLSFALDTYVLALSQTWYQATGANLLAGYHASAQQVGDSMRNLTAINYGENVMGDEKVRKGQYRRTALMIMDVTFYCGA